MPERSGYMIGKACCNTCVSLKREQKETKQGEDRYYYGCCVHGLIRKAIVSDSGLEHQSCDEWEAGDEKKIENRTMAETLGKELQALHDLWKQVYTCGGTDFNCPDGVELNLLRSRIISQRRRIRSCLLEADYPASYELGIPDMIGSQYMARREEIEAAAKRALQTYRGNKDYQWLAEKNPELSEKERKMSGIYYALGYVEQLEKAVEQDDCVLMRSHEVPEHGIELLRTCRDKVVRILKERKLVNIQPDKKKESHTGEQPQIPGQMDIFSFLAS